jgi:hypothetical protein
MLFYIFCSISIATVLLWLFVRKNPTKITPSHLKEIPFVTEGYFPVIGNIIPLALKPRTYIEDAWKKVNDRQLLQCFLWEVPFYNDRSLSNYFSKITYFNSVLCQ